MSNRNVIVMLDTETLGLGVNAIVTQAAFVVMDLDEDPDKIILHEEYFPIQPQMDLGRKVDASTLLWWLTGEINPLARKKFERNTGNDMEEFQALAQSFVTKLARELPAESEGSYEIWARGTDFDIAILKNFFAMIGIDLPWKYNMVRDLRTIMAEAGLSTADVIRNPSYIEHHALSDCRYQLECLLEARRQLRAQ